MIRGNEPLDTVSFCLEFQDYIFSLGKLRNKQINKAGNMIKGKTVSKFTGAYPENLVWIAINYIQNLAKVFL